MRAHADSDGMDHEKLKEEVTKSLHDAEERWYGKPVRKGGYSLWWCVVPIALVATLVAWWRFL